MNDSEGVSSLLCRGRMHCVHPHAFRIQRVSLNCRVCDQNWTLGTEPLPISPPQSHRLCSSWSFDLIRRSPQMEPTPPYSPAAGGAPLRAGLRCPPPLPAPWISGEALSILLSWRNTWSWSGLDLLSARPAARRLHAGAGSAAPISWQGLVQGLCFLCSVPLTTDLLARPPSPGTPLSHLTSLAAVRPPWGLIQTPTICQCHSLPCLKVSASLTVILRLFETCRAQIPATAGALVAVAPWCSSRGWRASAAQLQCRQGSLTSQCHPSTRAPVSLSAATGPQGCCDPGEPDWPRGTWAWWPSPGCSRRRSANLMALLLLMERHHYIPAQHAFELTVICRAATDTHPPTLPPAAPWVNI